MTVGNKQEDRVCDWCHAVATELQYLDAAGQLPADEHVPDVKKCMRCKSVAYCSKACQTLAWKQYHRRECSMIRTELYQKKKIHANPSLRLLCRLLCMKTMGALSQSDMRSFEALRSHVKALRPVMTEADHLGIGKDVVRLTSSDVDPSNIIKLFSIMNTNSFSAIGACNTALCDAVDIPFSMINHSCEANCFYFMEGRELVVRTLRDLSDGEEVTTMYIDVETCRGPLQARQEQLASYEFVCQCIRCIREQGQPEMIPPAVPPPTDPGTDAFTSMIIAFKYNIRQAFARKGTNDDDSLAILGRDSCLHTLQSWFRALLPMFADKQKFQHLCPIEEGTFLILYIGYLRKWERNLVEVYGEEVEYVRGAKRKVDNWMGNQRLADGSVFEDVFRSELEAAQLELLRWCEVPEEQAFSWS